MKNDGTYDKRTKDGRMANGKTLAPKATAKKMEKALNNTKKGGKKV